MEKVIAYIASPRDVAGGARRGQRLPRKRLPYID